MTVPPNPNAAKKTLVFPVYMRRGSRGRYTEVARLRYHEASALVFKLRESPNVNWAYMADDSVKDFVWEYADA